MLRGINPNPSLVQNLGLTVLIGYVNTIGAMRSANADADSLHSLLNVPGMLAPMNPSPYSLLTAHIKGNIVGAFCIDFLGPKYSQVTGLLLQSVVGFIMCGLYPQ